MTVNPQAQTILDAAAKAEAEGMPTPKELGAVALRDVFKKTRGAMNPTAPDVGLIEDLVIPGPGGDIPARYYRPAGADPEKKLPVLMYYHGGGWMVGDIETHDVICRMAANRGGFAVVNVDYRLAPEHKFPAAVDDTLASVEWALAGVDGRAIDPAKVAVGGDSAGGNLAAVVALMARDQGGPKLCLQVLVYPLVDYRCKGKSYEQFGKGYGILEESTMIWFQRHYLGRSKQNHNDWRASPLLAESHKGLAPAIILAAGCDVLRDEARAYAAKLATAGVSVDFKEYAGVLHGFFGLTQMIDEADQANLDAGRALVAAMAG